MRLATNNAIDRCTLTGSSGSGQHVIGNVQVDLKSLVHRNNGGGMNYTATWAASETLGVVCLPFCNLTPTASWRIRVYSDEAGASLVYDSGFVPACPAPRVAVPGLTAAQAASAYAYGGGACAVHWFDQVAARRLTVEVTDADTLQGYIEVARLWASAWWEPVYQVDVGASLSFASTSSQVRTDGGDLLTNIGPRMRRLSLRLSNLPPSDRTSLAGVLRATELAYPLLVSVFPNHTDAALERDYTIYGKFSALSVVTLGTVGTVSLPLEVEEA